MGADRPIRVLMIGKGWFPDQTGGLDRYFRDLLEQLPESRGVVVGARRAPAFKGARVRGVSEHDRPLAFRLWALARVIRKEAKVADVIDVHFALYAVVPLLCGAFRGKTLVVHFQGPWAEENVEKGDRSILRRRLRERVERLVYRRATLAITLTGAFRRVLVERYGVPPWRVKVLPPGVDLVRFSPEDRTVARQRWAFGPDMFVACCVRRLVPRMGLDLLLEAWQQLLTTRGREAGAPRLQLMIAGDGEMRSWLAEQLAAAGLATCVTLLGRVSDEALAELYRAADVNVVPSLSSEGFGLVVLEAAACGTPSIATRVGGLPEALGGLDPTLLVAAHDSNALARRLAAAESGDLPTRARTRLWAEQHPWHVVAERHREVYADALARTSGSRRKIRVAYVGHVAQLSGGEIALARLIDALDEVDAHVILAEDGPLVDRLLASGISVEVLPMRSRTRNLRKNRVGRRGVPITAVLDTLWYAARLSRRINTVEADLVHTNTLKAGVYGSLAARLARVPVVWHVRDRIAPDYLSRWAVILVRALLATLPDGVIANSQATRATLRSAPERTSVVYSIVHDPITSPPVRVDQRQPGRFVVGMVGRIAQWKGQDVFLRAFAQAFGSGTEAAVLVGAPMFGDAEQVYSEELRTLTQELGIADRVTFVGFRDDIWAELAPMDVFVHASVTPEPFGQVIVEAMLAGVPVIASAGGGPTEIVTHDVDGLLYPPGDVDALAASMRRLRTDAPLRAQLAANARTRAERFSPAVAATAVMALYDSALAARRT